MKSNKKLFKKWKQKLGKNAYKLCRKQCKKNSLAGKKVYKSEVIFQIQVYTFSRRQATIRKVIKKLQLKPKKNHNRQKGKQHKKPQSTIIHSTDQGRQDP